MKITTATATRVFKKWVKRLNGDTRVRFAVHVCNTEDETPEGLRDAVAAIVVEPGYFTGDLIVNAWKIDSQKELDAALAHEAVHLVLWPLWVVARAALGEEQAVIGVDLLEAAVEQVAHALVKR